MSHQRARASTRASRALLVFVAASIAFLAGPASAPANPNALRALIVEAMCNPGTPAATLGDQILGKSGGAKVELFDGAAATVSVAQLSSYDVVVAIGDCSWLAPVAMGDNLADFEDGGGVVVAAGADWRAGAGGRLFGRWISGGYSPYAVGSSTAFGYDNVGWQDLASPLLSGIPSFQDDEGGSPLSAYYRDSVSLAGGAAEIARWSDGTPAVAVKSRAVGVNAYVGDHYGSSAWRGNFGALVVNAAEVLGRHTLTVGKRGNGRGVVTSAPLGIRCGKSCRVDYVNGAEVTLTATALESCPVHRLDGARVWRHADLHGCDEHPDDHRRQVHRLRRARAEGHPPQGRRAPAEAFTLPPRKDQGRRQDGHESEPEARHRAEPGPEGQVEAQLDESLGRMKAAGSVRYLAQSYPRREMALSEVSSRSLRRTVRH